MACIVHGGGGGESWTQLSDFQFTRWSNRVERGGKNPYGLTSHDLLPLSLQLAVQRNLRPFKVLCFGC